MRPPPLLRAGLSRARRRGTGRRATWLPRLRRIATRLVFLSGLLVLVLRFLPVPFTPLMLQRLIEQGLDGRELRWQKSWRSLEEISPQLALAVVCAEDQQFPQHHGFDFAAIRKAAAYNERSARVRGGSTITQQTAKNVFLWPSRSWLRKGLEAYFTVWLELLWSKHRILEVYLNVVELGDGVYGAEAAARHYFGKPASALTREQAALLAATLPNPLAEAVRNPSASMRRRQAWILRQMNLWGGTLRLD